MMTKRATTSRGEPLPDDSSAASSKETVRVDAEELLGVAVDEAHPGGIRRSGTPSVTEEDKVIPQSRRRAALPAGELAIDRIAPARS